MRHNAFTIPLYSPGKHEEPRYRRELDALCRALDAYPSQRRACAHTLTGIRACKPKLIPGVGYPADAVGWVWESDIGGRRGHDAWSCSEGQGQSQVRVDHDVVLVANDRNWIVRLAQPYWVWDSKPPKMPPGIVARRIGLAPYGHGSVAFLVGTPTVIDALAERASDALESVQGRARHIDIVDALMAVEARR